MRTRIAALLCWILWAGCSEASRAARAPDPEQPAAPATARAPSTARTSTSPPGPPSRAEADDPHAARHEVSERRRDDDEPYLWHRFPVPLARARIDVVDVQMQDDLDRILDERGASLVINGGYYGTDARPEGLVVAGGRTLSPLLARIGGGVVTVRDGRARHFAADGFVVPRGVEFAIQCSPRLVVSGHTAIERPGVQTASRTALCLRDDGRALDVIVADREPSRGRAGPTLYTFAQELVAAGCEEALNLDGGPSTGFAWRGSDGPHAVLPRRGIRHAIVFTW